MEFYFLHDYKEILCAIPSSSIEPFRRVGASFDALLFFWRFVDSDLPIAFIKLPFLSHDVKLI